MMIKLHLHHSHIRHLGAKAMYSVGTVDVGP